MYVNSSLTAQRIAKICTGLRFFRIRDSTHQRENFSLGILVQFEVSLDSKRCRSLFELEVFQVRKLELYPGHGTICWKLCSSKVENSEEKTRRLRIRSSAEFLYSMTCVVICSHRRSPLSHFYRVSYRYFWRRDS